MNYKLSSPLHLSKFLIATKILPLEILIILHHFDFLSAILFSSAIFIFVRHFVLPLTFIKIESSFRGNGGGGCGETEEKIKEEIASD